ncbi:MAG TPA: alpha/beta hydrolase [Flavobacteriaceae bacterium]|nr:alpha/beta hydrolase [Flavobacteriaceae bacterium]
MIAIIQKICNLLIVFVCLNAFAQTTTEAFDVKITGNGEQALVFIPGLASSGKVFDETRAEFEDDFTCYTFTLAGFAGVTPMENPSFEKYKNAIADYLIKNGIENPVIIGHSLGGALSMAIAADYPELPKKIVVVDALPHLAALMPNPTSGETDCAETIAEMLAMPEEQFAETQRQTIQFMVSDSTKQERVLRWTLDSDRKTVATIYCNYLKMDLRQKIGKISVPALILLEPYFQRSASEIEAQFKNLETAKIKYAPQGRHFLMYGAKDWYLQQLHEFIQGE